MNIFNVCKIIKEEIKANVYIKRKRPSKNCARDHSESLRYLCIFFSAQMAQLLLQGFVTGNTFQFFDGLEQFAGIY